MAETTDEKRGPMSHPQERITDKSVVKRTGFWLWTIVRAVYRDIWLICITGLVVLALHSIQVSRHDSIEDGCNVANDRNESTIKSLDEQLLTRAEVPKMAQPGIILTLNEATTDPKKAEQAAQAIINNSDDPDITKSGVDQLVNARVSTVKLINQLSPNRTKQQCKEIADKQINVWP